MSDETPSNPEIASKNNKERETLEKVNCSKCNIEFDKAVRFKGKILLCYECQREKKRVAQIAREEKKKIAEEKGEGKRKFK